MFRKKSRLDLLKFYAEEVVDEVVDTLSWKRRQRRQQLLLYLNWVVWTLSGVLAVLIINLLLFLPSLRQVYWQALAGKGGLEKASTLLTENRWSELNQVSQATTVNFASSLNELKKIRLSPIGWLPFTRNKINDGVYLLETGSLVSRALAKSSALMDNFLKLLPDSSRFDLSKLDQKQKLAVIKLIADNQDDLLRAKNELTTAGVTLKKIKNRQLIMNQGIDLEELAQSIDDYELKINQAVILAKLLPILGGYPEPTNYLFVLQNSDELRPTGGFIGTLGVAQTSNGEVVKLETNDVYHLDMPALNKFKREPPAVLKKYLGIDNWYLRDVNWSPDWPTSAQLIAEVYAQENKLAPKPKTVDKFDLVIGLTPQAVIDLLAISGPIKVRGQIYNQTNFMNLLQDTTSRDFPRLGLSAWDRKVIIGEIAKEMQLKILAKADQTWPKLLKIVGDNLNAKNILVYSTNAMVAEQVANHHWSGAVEATAGDYLMVVDANLAALKTDALMNKSLSYELKATTEGLIARVQINYANRGNFSYKTTRYRTFTRIYVPLGSELIKASGFKGEPSEVMSGEELGKTYFGAFTEIEPGKIGGLSFEYKLPYNLYDLYQQGDYHLLWQKQPGAKISEINIDWQFSKPIKNYEPAVLYAYATGSRFRYKSGFLGDKVFLLNF